GRHRRLRGHGHLRRTSDPGPVRLVGRDDCHAALGAGVLRGRRRDLGDELGDGVHARGRRRRPMTMLAQMGRVSPEYRHVEKLARPGPSLGLDDTILKWYDIAPADAPVPAEIRELARDG